MINSVVLVGRLGADPEIKYFENGGIKTTFNIAVDRGKRSDGTQETDWFRIETWGKLAEISGEYLRKGKLVGIEGRLEINRWTDANGNKHEMPAINASNMRMLGSKGEDSSSS